MSISSHLLLHNSSRVFKYLFVFLWLRFLSVLIIGLYIQISKISKIIERLKTNMSHFRKL